MVQTFFSSAKALKQQVVADGIDQARRALGAQVNFRQQLFREHGLVRHPGFFQARLDVIHRIAQRERLQIAAQDDSLLQLPQIGRVQLAIELRLPGQDDLQQLAVAIFQVPQQADFFEHFPFEVVRFIDDQDHGASELGLLDQKLVQGKQNFGLRGALRTADSDRKRSFRKTAPVFTRELNRKANSMYWDSR